MATPDNKVEKVLGTQYQVKLRQHPNPQMFPIVPMHISSTGAGTQTTLDMSPHEICNPLP
jgi:hypothetical protein